MYVKAMYKQADILSQMKDYHSALAVIEQHIQKLDNSKDVKLLNQLKIKIDEKYKKSKNIQKSAGEFEKLLEKLDPESLKTEELTPEIISDILSSISSNSINFETLITRLHITLKSYSEAKFFAIKALSSLQTLLLQLFSITLSLANPKLSLLRSLIPSNFLQDLNLITPKNIPLLCKIYTLKSREILDQVTTSSDLITLCLNSTDEFSHDLTSDYYRSKLPELLLKSGFTKISKLALLRVYREELEFVLQVLVSEEVDYEAYDLVSEVAVDLVLKKMKAHGHLEELLESFVKEREEKGVVGLVCKLVNVPEVRERLGQKEFYENLLRKASYGGLKISLLVAKLTIGKEFDIVRDNEEVKDLLATISENTVKKLVEFNFQNNNEENVEELEDILQTLALLCMLYWNKKIIYQTLIEHEDLQGKLQEFIIDNKNISLEHAYILFILNLMRTNDYDKLPSRSYKH